MAGALMTLNWREIEGAMFWLVDELFIFFLSLFYPLIDLVSSLLIHWWITLPLCALAWAIMRFKK